MKLDRAVLSLSVLDTVGLSSAMSFERVSEDVKLEPRHLRYKLILLPEAWNFIAFT